MTLPALDQEFLVHHYSRWGAAEALVSDESAERLATSSRGGAGPNRATFATDRRGIHYTMPGEEDPEDRYDARGWLLEYRRTHTITWAQIRRHRRAQPAALIDELAKASRLHTAEARHHSDTCHAINEEGYRRATPEQQQLLDAEWERHIAAHHALRDRVWAAVDAILPLATTTSEPTDLIEWADALLGVESVG